MSEEGTIIRLNLYYAQQGSSTPMTVHHYRVTNAAIANDDVVAILDDWLENDWADKWTDRASNEASIIGYDVQEVSAAGTVIQNLGADTVAYSGDIVSDNASAAVSGLMVGYTNVPKRRGRKFVPGLAQTQIQNGVFNAATLADLALLALIYIADIPDPGGTGLLRAGVLSIIGMGFTYFNDSVTVSDVPAYQRRRKPDVGS